MKYVVIVSRFVGVNENTVYGPFDTERDAFLWLQSNRPKQATTLVRPLKEVA